MVEIQLSRVVFPEPEAPIIPKNSPGSTEKLISRIAFVCFPRCRNISGYVPMFKIGSIGSSSFRNFLCLYCNLCHAFLYHIFLHGSYRNVRSAEPVQPCTPVTKSLIGKEREIVVPWPLELAEIPIPSLSQRRLQRYRPIPVELWILRPFSPVNPFSKIRGRSPAGMPMPLSSTDNRTRSFSIQVKKCKTRLVCTIFYEHC